MARDPRATAEACFEVARRSTTLPGERDAAINRGIRIAERAGLSLDSFDIPGRAKAERPFLRASIEDSIDDLFGGRNPFEAVFMQYEAELRRASRRHSDVTAREFADAVAAEREARQARNDADRAVAFLRARGIMVRRTGPIGEPRRWTIPGDGREFSDGGVYEQAVLKGMIK